MKLPLLASATLAVLAVVPGVLSDKPSLRAVAQPIEDFQEAVFDAVAKHSSRDEWRDTDSSNDTTDMEMISTEVENNRSRNRRSRNRRSRNRRRRRRRSRNRRSRRNRSRRRRRSRGRRSFRRSFRRNDFCRFGRISVDRNGRLRCFDSATGMTLLSEKPVTTTTTSDDVDEYQYVMIDEKPQEDATDRAIDDEDEDSGDDEDYDSWDEDEDEDDSSDSPDTEEW